MLRALMPDLLAHTGSVGFTVSAISAASSEERRQGHKRRERGPDTNPVWRCSVCERLCQGPWLACSQVGQIFEQSTL